MSIIDRLVIQLGMDTKGFSGEARKSVEQLRQVEKQAQATGSGMERDGVKAASFFSGVRREALAMFAVFTGGKSLKAFVTDTAQANAQLGYMARNLNMDPSQLYRLEAAAKAAGGSFGEVAQTFGSLQQRLTDPKQWAEVTNAFSQLGVTDFLDKKGNINPNLAALLNHGIHAQHLSNAKAIALMNQVNIGAGMQNLGLMSEDEFSKFQAKQNSLSAPSDEDIKNLAALNQSLANLKRENDALASSLAGQLSPELQKVIDQFTKWEQEHPEPAKVIAGIAFAVDELGKSLNGLGSILVGMTGLSILKKLFGGDKKALRAAIEEIRALRAGTALPETAPSTVTGASVLSRLLSYGGAVVEGLHLNSAINSDRKQVNEIAQAAQKGSVTNSPLFEAMSSAVAGIEHAAYNQMGGAGHRFAGRYQMGADEIRETAQHLGENAPTQAAFLADPSMQERYFKEFTKQHEWYLIEHNEQFRSMNDAQKLAALAYAHNQGAAGADRWLKTGVAGADQFGTSGALYATRTLDALDGRKVEPSGAGAGDTVLRYGSPQSAQEEAIKRLIDAHAALKDQMAQASKTMGTSDVARMAASVTAGDSPGSASNTTTTNHNASFNGDVVIHTNATDAQGMARDAVAQLRKQLSSNNMSGLQ